MPSSHHTRHPVLLASCSERAKSSAGPHPRHPPFCTRVKPAGAQPLAPTPATRRWVGGSQGSPPASACTPASRQWPHPATLVPVAPHLPPTTLCQWPHPATSCRLQATEHAEVHSIDRTTPRRQPGANPCRRHCAAPAPARLVRPLLDVVPLSARQRARRQPRLRARGRPRPAGLCHRTRVCAAAGWRSACARCMCRAALLRATRALHCDLNTYVFT